MMAALRCRERAGSHRRPAPRSSGIHRTADPSAEVGNERTAHRSPAILSVWQVRELHRTANGAIANRRPHGRVTGMRTLLVSATGQSGLAYAAAAGWGSESDGPVGERSTARPKSSRWQIVFDDYTQLRRGVLVIRQWFHSHFRLRELGKRAATRSVGTAQPEPQG